MDKEDKKVPKAISFPDQVFGIDFHPYIDVVAAGLINGMVEVHNYSVEDRSNCKVFNSNPHNESCRSVMFNHDGQVIISASKDCSIVASNSSSGEQQWSQPDAHSAAINSLYLMGENAFASGDDEGAVKLWDIRQKESTKQFKYHKDFISDILIHESEPNTVLITGGDGRLSIVDSRNGKLLGQSEEMEDELLSLAVVKHGKKVVCGTQDGNLLIFSWGQWAINSDKFPGHPQSIDTLLKVDEQTVCSGSSDGLLRVVNILPNKFLGVIGDHDGFPVERIKFSRDKKFIGSTSHDSQLRFWNASVLFDDDDDDDDDDNDKKNGIEAQGEEKNTERKDLEIDTQGKNEQDSIEEDSDSSEDESDKDITKGPKRLKTAAENFFADL